MKTIEEYKTENDRLRKKINDLENEISSIKATSKTLLYNATHDCLTDLYNRHMVGERLFIEFQRYNRYKYDLSIAMFDIDCFKKVNDTYGHDIGDEVLVAVSKILQDNIRGVDILSRWGGEEFLLLFPQTTGENASIVVDKLRLIVEKTRFLKNDIKITISAGLTNIKDADDKDILLRRVDEALYKAKSNGRNQVVVA